MIDAPIGRHRSHDWKLAVTKNGRHSLTHYDTLKAFVAASLLECTWKLVAHTRSGCISPRCTTAAVVT
jgi:hypothetical protein